MVHFIGDQSEYAVSTWFFKHEQIETAINKLKNSGFNRIELWADQVHADPRLNNLSGIKNALSKNDVEVHSVHAPFSGIGNEFQDPSFFEKWEELLDKTAEYCSELNSELMVLHILNRSAYNLFSNNIEKVCCFIENMSEKFRSRGVKILLENLIGSGAPGEFECTIPELKRVFGSLDIGFCIDISHSVLTNQDIENEIRIAGDKLLSVHVSSTDGKNDLHLPLDQGVINWHEMYGLFRRMGYKGDFVLEINGRDCPDEIMSGIENYFSK